jgi:transposase InsO family protein
VGDYLSMPTGKGGYHTVGLYLDTFSQHIFGYKHKTAGTAKTTVLALEDVTFNFAPSQAFMTDGGKHFANTEVKKFCEKWGIKFVQVAGYSPWINGLIKGANKIFLGVLKRLCCPGLGEDKYEKMTKENIPESWPDHFNEAIHHELAYIISAQVLTQGASTGVSSEQCTIAY